MDSREIEGLLLYAGVGIYSLFLIFSLFSVWANGIIFSWLTVKYFFLLGAGVLTLVLDDAPRRKYSIAFAAFLGLLFYADQVTFHGKQIEVLAGAQVTDVEEDQKEFDEEIKHAEAIKELKRNDQLHSSLRRVTMKGDKDLTKDEAKERFVDTGDFDDLVEERNDLEKTIKEQRQDLKEFVHLREGEDIEKISLDSLENRFKISDGDHVLDLVQLKHAKEDAREQAEKDMEDLIWAKGYDAFILFGAFLILAGALVGGAAAEEAEAYYGSTASHYGGYTPPAAPPAPAAPAAPAAAPAPPPPPPPAPPAAAAPPAPAPAPAPAPKPEGDAG
ncbi:MAG: hypothetical protein ACYS22_09970 [Planctomycetota bacterium]|jgi:hypothetical protein